MNDEKAKALNLDDLVADVAPQVREILMKKTAERVAESLSWTLEAAVKERCATYIAEHVMPEVDAKLRERRDVLVTAICEGVAASCNQLRDAMIAMVAKKLGDSYQVEKIAKQLIGGSF